MKRKIGLTVLISLAMSACGGGGSGGGGSSAPTSSNGGGGTGATNSSDARGTLQQNPPQLMASMTASAIAANSNATVQATISSFGAPVCGVDVHYLKYGTIGGAGEATNATGALMLPTGSSPACVGAHPIVVYAHGTALTKGYNLANILDSTNEAFDESVEAAIAFAGQGFIVVAPNYAGYDTSKLQYHPYLNADQQSKEVIDALTAARSALPNLGASDSGKLFLTGHSQGGYVTAATHRAMQAAGLTVTASAPSSGTYAMNTFADTIFLGKPSQFINIFTPLIITSYQHAYGNLYANLTDIYNSVYANGLDAVFPSNSTVDALISQGVIPTALFSAIAPTAPAGSATSLQAILNADTIPPTSPAALASTYAAGFGARFMINDVYRASYIIDALANPDGTFPTLTSGLTASSPGNTLRQAFKQNDLRNWTPTSPILLCGGNGDPMVFFDSNALNMQRYWSAPSTSATATGVLSVLDVDSPVTGSSDVFAPEKNLFTTLKAQIVAQAIASGATDGGTAAVLENYHPTMVSAACLLAARDFFQQHS